MRYALSVSVTAVLFSACGGGSSPLAQAPRVVNYGFQPLIKSRTFHFTGREQKFRVPDGVTSVTIILRGAQGGGENGGRGGRVYAVIPVSPGDRLNVFVGGQGNDFERGYNGGGYGGLFHPNHGFGYGGGGASDIRLGNVRLSDRIIVAGGGGGEGEAAFDEGASPAYYDGSGGEGGGSTGGAGESGGTPAAGSGGGGGGQNQGGLGGGGGEGQFGSGNSGSSGDRGVGGNGGGGCYSVLYSLKCDDTSGNGAGGGGGYYGGGGGGAGGLAGYFTGGGGGGGGSSYIEPNAKKFQSWQGWKNALGDGLVVISWK